MKEILINNLEKDKLYTINILDDIRNCDWEIHQSYESVINFFKDINIKDIDVNDFRIIINYDEYMITCQ